MVVAQCVLGLDKGDFQLIADPSVALVTVLLVQDHLGPQFVRIHSLGLFEEVECLALD